MTLVRHRGPVVHVQPGVTLDPAPRLTSATMHEAFAQLRGGAPPRERTEVPRVPVHVVKLRRRKR